MDDFFNSFHWHYFEHDIPKEHIFLAHGGEYQFVSSPRAGNTSEREGATPWYKVQYLLETLVSFWPYPFFALGVWDYSMSPLFEKTTWLMIYDFPC